MYVKKFTSFCEVLKMMHTKENWFLFSATTGQKKGKEPLFFYE